MHNSSCYPTDRPCRRCGWPFGVAPDGLCENCRRLQSKPDELSTSKTFRGVPFQDLKQVDESDRFVEIAACLTRNPGQKIAVMVDTGPGFEDKGDRYIKGVRILAPKTRVVNRFPGPARNSETIVFTLDPGQAM